MSKQSARYSNPKDRKPFNLREKDKIAHLAKKRKQRDQYKRLGLA